MVCHNMWQFYSLLQISTGCDADMLLCRALHAQHAATVQQELASWHQQQGAAALAAQAEKAGLARDTAWQLVQLAERVVEFRAATGGQAVPLADWRSWLSLLMAGGCSPGTSAVVARAVHAHACSDTRSKTQPVKLLPGC